MRRRGRLSLAPNAAAVGVLKPPHPPTPHHAIHAGRMGMAAPNQLAHDLDRLLGDVKRTHGRRVLPPPHARNKARTLLLHLWWHRRRSRWRHAPLLCVDRLPCVLHCERAAGALYVGGGSVI